MKRIATLIILLWCGTAWGFNPLILLSGTPRAACTVTETPEDSCSDGIDNDCDGFTDGADSDCAGITNLISNGDFSTLDCTGWDLDALTCNASTGSAVLVTDPYGSIGQANVLMASTQYHFSIDIVVASASDFNIGDAGGTFYTIPAGTSGTVTGTFIPSSVHFSIQAWGGSSGATITIDNIVVWQ